MTPEFKAGRYAEGIRAGTTRVADIIRKNHTLTAEERDLLLEKANANEPPVWRSASFANGFRQKAWRWVLFGGPFAGLPPPMLLVFSRTVFYIEAVVGAVVF